MRNCQTQSHRQNERREERHHINASLAELGTAAACIEAMCTSGVLIINASIRWRWCGLHCQLEPDRHSSL
jgi:hypothetical protein